MQSKFGLKDFVLMMLVVLVGLGVWIKMFQDDRAWGAMQENKAKLREIEQQLARLQRSLDAGVIAAPVSGPSARPAGSAAGSAPGSFPWAREGVEVTISQPWTYSTDPYEQEGFEEGGRFTELLEGQPPKLTPFLYADVYGRRVVDQVCESLGWYDPETLKMRGRLAEAWQYPPDGMWLRAKIHDRARFSDGEPVLAEDVRFSFHDVIHNEQIEAERFRGVYNGIARVEVVGDPATSKVVEFHFKETRFDNLEQAFGFKVIPKHIYSGWIESPTRFNESTGLLIGSGPFKMERVDPDDQWTPPSDIVLVRNELYWGPRAPLAEYRYGVIQDRLALLTAYTNGQGDMMRATSEQFDAKVQDPSFLEAHNAKNWFNMQGGYSFIAWQCGPRNGRLTPFHDQRVRMAMTHLIDRDRIRRDIDKDLTRPATGPFLSSTPQADPSVTPWPYDLARARELLAEAGWVDRDNDGVLENERGDEFEFEIKFGHGSPGTLQMCEYIRGECARVGIRMKLTPIDWSTLQPTLSTRDFDAVTFAWSASAPENDPNQIWHSSSIQNQGDNFIQWNSAEADRLIEEGRRKVDADERMKVWHELHRHFHAEQPYTFLSEMPWLRFATKRSRNLQEYASGLEGHEFWVSSGSVPVQN